MKPFEQSNWVVSTFGFYNVITKSSSGKRYHWNNTIGVNLDWDGYEWPEVDLKNHPEALQYLDNLEALEHEKAL